MIKIIAGLRRKRGMSREEFAAYYRDHHMALARRTMPREVAERIVHYAQNHARIVGSGTFEPPYDCVTEIGFEDEAGMRAYTDWYRGSGGAAVRDDEKTFLDSSEIGLLLITDEERIPFGADPLRDD